MEMIRILKSDDDFAWAVREIEACFDNPPAPGSLEENRLELLTTLVNAYEAKNWPLPELEPVEFLESFMQNRGYSRSDLAEVLGSQSRATEILKKKRPLTLAMIQNLHKQWNIPANALIAPYSLER